MTMSLSPTARGLRLIRATQSLSVILPPPTGVVQQTLLVTDANDQIVTETGARIITETA